MAEMLPARVVGPPARVRPPWKARVSDALSPNVVVPALESEVEPLTDRFPVKERLKGLEEVVTDPAVKRP